ncbi:MAG: hypothetical protein H0U12_09745 [Thermoleophilaceae bacterium]|jgi:hypothetical protein|nr:hypothetical protein [Thermoleophilaceae bacterium]
MLSLFGLAVTLGLVSYNSRNDQLYDALVGRAAEIERSLHLSDGAFAHRPRPWLTIRLLGVAWQVEHRRSVATIYGASIALWLSLLLSAVIQLGWRAIEGTAATPPWLVVAAVALGISLAAYGLLAAPAANDGRHRKICERRRGGRLSWRPLSISQRRQTIASC